MKTIYELKVEYREACAFLARSDKSAHKKARGNMLALMGSSNIRALQGALAKKSALQRALEESGLSKFEAEDEIDKIDLSISKSSYK